MTTTDEVTPQPMTVRRMRPVLRHGRASCPRCGARLQRDYEGLSCVACGFEYEPDADDEAWGLFPAWRAA